MKFKASINTKSDEFKNDDGRERLIDVLESLIEAIRRNETEGDLEGSSGTIGKWSVEGLGEAKVIEEIERREQDQGDGTVYIRAVAFVVDGDVEDEWESDGAPVGADFTEADLEELYETQKAELLVTLRKAGFDTEGFE